MHVQCNVVKIRQGSSLPTPHSCPSAGSSASGPLPSRPVRLTACSSFARMSTALHPALHLQGHCASLPFLLPPSPACQWPYSQSFTIQDSAPPKLPSLFPACQWLKTKPSTITDDVPALPAPSVASLPVPPHPALHLQGQHASLSAPSPCLTDSCCTPSPPP